MCGIAGTYSFVSGEPVDRNLLERMTLSLAHRGPDGCGYFYSKNRSLGFGHRRLSIIDLETGDQPMSNEDGSVWITFNGEIYNYRELRAQLLGCGHKFKSSSDTEVILHAYEEWGVECVNRFNGIFAFGIWNEKQQRLFLARDHFGVKPLYYCLGGKKIHFASELKAILCDPGVSREIDLDALHMCLTFRHTPSPWTLFKSIRKLPPASFLIADRNGVRTKNYSSSLPEVNHRKTEPEWIEELAATYRSAVRRQMVADTPIGLSLSGGVDSNTLLALMSLEGKQVHSFTVGFEGAHQRDDELEAAEGAAHVFESDFSGRRVSEDDYMSFMSSYMWHLEEPIGNESAAAYYFVAKLARPKVKVLLSGQGADEPFAGYGRHLAAQYAGFLDWVPKPFVRPLGFIVSPFFRGSESPGRLTEFLSQEDEIHSFLSAYSITSSSVRRKLFSQGLIVRSNPNILCEYVRAQLAQAPPGTMLEKMAYIDARTSLTDNLLLSGDKMAMAAGVEMRVPYLDREIMKVAESIPGSFKVRDFNTKVVHKKVCARWLPESTVHRRKIGFHEAMGKWMRQNLDRTLTELTACHDSITRTMLDLKYVRQLQREHNSGRFDHQRILFLLLSVEMWRKVFV